MPSVEALLDWGREAGFALERMIEGDLAGLIDGPTSADVTLTGGLTVFDISALPDDGPAVLRATFLRQVESVPTVFVIEEGWHLVEGSFAKVTQRNQKVSRETGLMNVTALQHVSDVARDPLAMATVQESETVVIYGQSKESDAAECVRLFNLPAAAKGVIMELPPGTFLFKIGSQNPNLVTHMRSQIETRLTNTDDAMTSTATVGLGEKARAAAAQMAAELDGLR